MKPIQTIEKLIPWPILNEIAMVLERGSRKDGKGVLTNHKSYTYYTRKLIKHLLRGLWGFKYDHDSGQSHYGHAVVRLIQLWLKHKEEK